MQFRHEDFLHDYLVPAFTRTRNTLGVYYPDIFLILGNDDPVNQAEKGVAALLGMTAGVLGSLTALLTSCFW